MTHHLHANPDLDRGLAFDVSTLMNRRRALQLLAGGSLAALVGCGANAASGTDTATTGTTEIPDETAGPYPGDGSNGPNVLTASGIVRSDLRSSFGQYSGTAGGIPLKIDLTVLDLDNSSAPYAGAAVYLWQCDREGRYSLYSDGVTDQNYLRGVQVAATDGSVSFTSIFPAAYSGRWPHIHFEVYASVQDATGGGEPVSTSQLALPQDVCATVYATEGYEASVRNLAESSLSDDNVFGDDDAASQLATVTGSVAAGYVASLTVPVAASTAVQSQGGPGGRPGSR